MSKNKQRDPENGNNASLSSDQPAKTGDRFVSMVFDYVEIIVFSICAVLILFMLCGRLCRVNGNSMLKTLNNGELLITTSIGPIERGDIVVFHQTDDLTKPVAERKNGAAFLNEPLVKRVIGMGGDTVRIDYKASKVYLNGEELNEPYAALLARHQTAAGVTYVDINQMTLKPQYNYDSANGIFEVTVPDGCYFVMGDNRNNSADSRSVEVGCVDGRRMLGHVVLRLKPYTVFD